LHPLLRLLFSLLSEVLLLLLLLLLLRALLGRERRQHRGGIVRRVSPLHPHLLLLLLHRLLLREPSPSSFSSYHPSYYRSRLQRIVAMEESRGADAAGIHHRLPRRLAEGARSATVAEGRPPGADTGSYHPADARMLGRGGADRRTERRGRHGSLAHDPEPPRSHCGRRVTMKPAISGGGGERRGMPRRRRERCLGRRVLRRLGIAHRHLVLLELLLLLLSEPQLMMLLLLGQRLLVLLMLLLLQRRVLV
jgi:hypothetical protein